MAMKAVASVFAPKYSNCFAECENFNYQDLIVTKCNHIFCRVCLGEWLLRQSKDTDRTCPLDNKVLSLITPENVRDKDEDPKINEANITEGMQYTSFNLHLERFIYYIQKDFPTLQKALASEKILKLSSCELLKVTPKIDSQGSNEDQCSVCITPFPQMYFIIQDTDQTRIGRFMHDDCWRKTVDDKSILLEISARNVAIIAEKLPPPKVPAKEPFKTASPAAVFFAAIILPVSLWAFAMNERIYHNKSFALFVLSIPALIIFKLINLILKGLKAVITAKPI